MSKKKKYLRKLLAIPLSAAMIAGVGMALSAGISESILTVNAVESTIAYGDFSYQLLEDETVCITKYSGSDSAVTIPSNIDGKPVTQIGNNAFYWRTGLMNVIIPDSVTSIGEQAFSCCYRLTSVIIPDSVRFIGKYAFYNCTSLASVVISNNVISINNGVFSRTKLTSVTIPNGVISIGEQAFSYCTSLTNVTIPNSVISINNGAFSNCTNLMNVTIPNSVTFISKGAFSSCISLASITVSENNTKYSSNDGVLLDKNRLPRKLIFLLYKSMKK